MKKIIKKSATVFVLMLFILSIVPMAFAEDAAVGGDITTKVEVDDDSTDVEVEVEAKTETTSEKESDEDSFEDEKEAFKEEKGSFKGELKEFKGQMKEKNEAMKESFKEQRQFTKEQVEQLRERMNEAKNNYEQARERYKEQKDDLKDLRDEFKSCKESDESENCVKVRKNVNTGVKNHLAKTIELIDNSIARLREHVNSSTVLSDEEKKSALDSINKLEEQVTAEKDKVAAMGDDVSKEDLKVAVKELKQLWQDVSKQQRRIVAMLTSSKLDNLVEKQKEIATSMQKRIDDAKAKGLDTTELESILVQFNTSVAKVEESQKTARTFWQETEDVSKEGMEKWHDAQEDVREDVKESREILREFVQNYQELTKPTTVKVEEDAVVEATVKE